MPPSLPSSPLVVTADDTTGALETAAACADAGWSCLVAVGHVAVGDEPVGSVHDLVVLDLRSRHLPADEAASRVRAVVEREAGLRAHKIDSTLRGNWAAEVTAIAHAGRRVLLVPAFPAAGRTCVDGTVLVHGVPVHLTEFGADPRSPVADSQPAQHLPGAVAAHDLGTVRAAFADGARVVVADAATDADIARLVGLVGDGRDHLDVVLAGPAAVIAALVHGTSPQRPAVTPAPLVPRALVVSASLHPMAAAQFDALAARGVQVVRPPADARIEDADGVLARLAAAVVSALSTDPSIATVVIVGGDTAAAVLGGASVEVDGTLGVGVAVGSVTLAGRRLRLVTKPGGFGDPGTLVDVLHDALADPT